MTDVKVVKIELDNLDELPGAMQEALRKAGFGLDRDTTAKAEALRDALAAAGYDEDERCGIAGAVKFLRDSHPENLNNLSHLAFKHEIIGAARLLLAHFTLIRDADAYVRKVQAKANVDFATGIQPDPVVENIAMLERHIAQLEAKRALAAEQVH